MEELRRTTSFHEKGVQAGPKQAGWPSVAHFSQLVSQFQLGRKKRPQTAKTPPVARDAFRYFLNSKLD